MADSNSTKLSMELNLSKLSAVIFSFLGTASNVLLLAAYMKDPLKCFRNSGTYLLMNLSVSDLMTCLFAPFYLEFIVITGLDCVFSFIGRTSGIASILSIVSISFDRLLLVVYPLKHRVFIKGRNMVIWLFGIWLMASFLPTIGIFYGGSAALTGLNFSILILVVLSASMYAITYSKLKEHSKSIALQNSTENRAQEIRIQKDKQFLRTIILIACIALVCIVPPMVYLMLYQSLRISGNNLLHKIISHLFFIALYTNFAINPLIYIARLQNYRKTFYLIYCKRAH